MSFFKGIGGVKPPVNSEYFRAGRYVTRIKKFIAKKNRKERPNVIWEMTVVAVLDTAASSADPMGAHQLGAPVSWVLDMTKDPSLPNLKAALMVATGVLEEKIDEEFCDALATEAQPLAGIFVEWDNKVILTRESKKPFTLIKARRVYTADEVRGLVAPELLESLKIELK